MDWSFWGILLVTAVFGMLGGLVYELLILQGNIELPHKSVGGEITEKYAYAVVANLQDWGIFARLIIGAAAAIAALMVLTPQTAIALVATALVAGSVGTSIFRSLQDRILAALAVKETADTKQASAKAESKVKEAQKVLDQLRSVLPAGGIPLSGVQPMGPGGEIFPPASLQQSLDQATKLLSEARGIHQAINE